MLDYRLCGPGPAVAARGRRASFLTCVVCARVRAWPEVVARRGEARRDEVGGSCTPSRSNCHPKPRKGWGSMAFSKICTSPHLGPVQPTQPSRTHTVCLLITITL